MGFEIDKSAEELKQNTSHVISNEQAVGEENTAPLSDAETQDLTYNLSGEAQTTGFNEKEAEELTKNLTGESSSTKDNTNNIDPNTLLQSTTFTDGDNSNLLNILSGRLQFIINKYPNITKAFVQAGIITFLDKNNNVIKDKNGKPLTIDYNSLKNSSQFNLIVFYLEHSEGEIDLEKMLQLHQLQSKFYSTNEDDENYPKIKSELEVEKLQIMNDDEKKEYTAAKLLKYFNDNNFSSLIDILGEFYHEKCDKINKSLKNNNASKLIYTPILASLSDRSIINLIVQIISSQNDDISKKELIWKFVQKVGEFIDKSLNSAYLTDLNSISKNAEFVKDTCPELEVEIQKYLHNIISKQDELTLNGDKLENLTPKELRKKITEAASIEELNGLQERIYNSSFSKAEKQVLHNEFLKQKGILIAQNNSYEEVNDGIKTDSHGLEFDTQRIKSSIAFELFKICKTPAQREMANFILSDERIYLVKGNAKAIFEQILEQCKTQEDLEMRKQLFEKALSNPATQENGVINTDILTNISKVSTNSFEFLSKLFETKQNKNSLEFKNIQDTIKELSTFDYNFDSLDLLEFSKRIISDDSLKGNKTALETLLLVLRSNNINKDSLEIIYNILKTNSDKYNADEIVNAANKFISDKEYTQNFINDFVENEFELKNTNNKEDEILGNLLTKDAKIYKEFIDTRDCSKEHFYDIFKHSQYSYGKDILSEVCNQQQYSAENIIDILKFTSEKTSGVSKQVLEKRNITVNEKVNVLYTISNNLSQMSLIKLILSKEDINLKCLPKLLSSMKTLSNNNVKSNKDEISPEKIDKYVQLLQNPKSSPWVIKMLNEGWDIETISQLNPTRLKLYANKNNKIIDEKDPNKKFFMTLGFNNEEAEEITKAITKNGTVNNEMKEAALKLLNTGVPRHRIGKILSSAITTGEYNSKITTDVMSITTLGVNSFLERFLPIANNLSEKELKNNLSPDIRKHLLVMINQIPQNKKPALKAEGFDLDGIVKKLNRITSEKEENSHSTADSKLIALEQNSPAIKIWASKKYENMKNDKRNNLNLWFEFLDTEPEIKNNPLIKLIISEHLTNNLNNDSLETAPSKEYANKILAEFIANSKNKDEARETTINNKKMIWHSIPQTNSSSSDFTSNVSKIEQLSKNTNLNIDTQMLEQNNLHFLVDENGQTQAVMSENKNGEITNILNPKDKKNSIPLAYADFIQEFADKNKLTGFEEELKTANKNKPEFENNKSELQKLAENKNYKAILEKLGIEVNTLPDGTWEISHYTSFIDNVTLNEYGISENELLSNVSKIKGDADFTDSNATDLHNLKYVDGEIKFGDSQITDMSSIEEINKKKIHWHLS